MPRHALNDRRRQWHNIPGDSCRSGLLLSETMASWRSPMNSWTDKIREGLLKNPFAWILFVLLVIAEYGNYQRGKELDHVCELTGPHDVGFVSPKNDKEELDTICISRQPDD
jgi:hypothetical protein